MSTVQRNLGTVGKMKKMALASAMVGALGIGLTVGSGDVEASEYTYEVQSGDTLNKIAQDHQTSLDKLAELNNIENINIIYPGQTLQLSGESTETVSETQTQESVTESQSTSGYHIVQSGDSLYKISLEYGISINQIQTWNNLSSDLIFPGDELSVSQNTSNEAPTVVEETEEVVEYGYVDATSEVETEPAPQVVEYEETTEEQPQQVEETEEVQSQSSSRTPTAQTTNVSSGSSSASSNATQSTSSNASGQNWGALANCESGGDASIVSANGLYHGLYQFDTQTWQSVGGSGNASDASAAEQTQRAQMLYDDRGSQPWPVCGARL